MVKLFARWIVTTEDLAWFQSTFSRLWECFNCVNLFEVNYASYFCSVKYCATIFELICTIQVFESNCIVNSNNDEEQEMNDQHHGRKVARPRPAVR